MNEKCLIEGCDKEPSTRGLCYHHYQSVMYAIRKGKTTEAEAVALGIIKPNKNRLPNGKTLIEQVLEKKRSEREGQK